MNTQNFRTLPLLSTLLLITLITGVLTSCATSLEGRRQLMLMSSDEMDSMGAQSFEQLKQQTPLTTNKNIQQYVVCIANRIIPYVQQSPDPRQWEIQVFEGEQANAFALPGNKIGVYTGLLKYAQNQDQLAAVMGHEVAHVISGHSNERVSSQMATQVGLSLATVALGVSQSENNGLILAGLGLGAQYGIILPFSRKHETEADLIGLNLIAQAGFNPAESVPLWQNMSQAGAAPPEFMSTHPSNSTRIKQLKERIPQANLIYQKTIAKGQRANCQL